MARSFLDSPRFFYGWSVVAIAFVTMGVGVNARTAFSLLFPPILDEFGWPRGVTAGAFSFGFLVSGVLGPILGRVMDRRGPRVVMLLGVALAGAGLGLAPLITAPWNLYMTLGVLVGGGTVCLGYTGHALFLLLLAMRHQPTPVLLYSMVVAQGVFGYGLASVLGAIPAELFQGKQYGTIFGTLRLASIVGGAIGPWVAGVLHDRTGSDVLALWLAVGACVVSAVAMWLAAPRKVRAVAGRVPRRLYEVTTWPRSPRGRSRVPRPGSGAVAT